MKEQIKKEIRKDHDIKENGNITYNKNIRWIRNSSNSKDCHNKHLHQKEEKSQMNNVILCIKKRREEQ